MIRELRSKMISVAEAKLWRLWTITSTVSGTTMAWRMAQSRSLSDQPPPFDAFRWSTIDSFAPVEARGEGLPTRREEKLLGEPGQSQRKLPWKSEM